METLRLDGHGLQLADVVSVARRGQRVVLGAEARRAMEASAALIDGFVAADTPVYGVTTGFGALANTAIPVERTAELQVALVRSHAAGMGDTVDDEIVRAMVLLRARSLAMARSGVRPELVELQLALLDSGLTPVVHEHGSLGASGDLAPLSHCALVLIGEGEVRTPSGAIVPALEALAAALLTATRGVLPTKAAASRMTWSAGGAARSMALLMPVSWVMFHGMLCPASIRLWKRSTMRPPSTSTMPTSREP